MSGVNDLVQTFITEYKKTPPKLKVCNTLAEQTSPSSVAAWLMCFTLHSRCWMLS